MRKAVVLSLLLLATPALAETAAPAAPSPKEAKVRKLLTLTGADAMGKQIIDAMTQQFSTMPGLPPGFIERFKEEASKTDLVSMLVPVYVKHLSEKDLDGAIAFYSSEAGVAMVKAQPAIVAESMQIGQQWGGEIAQRVIQEMQAAGEMPKKEEKSGKGTRKR